MRFRSWLEKSGIKNMLFLERDSENKREQPKFLTKIVNGDTLVSIGYFRRH